MHETWISTATIYIQKEDSTLIHQDVLLYFLKHQRNIAMSHKDVAYVFWTLVSLQSQHSYHSVAIMKVKPLSGRQKIPLPTPLQD